MTSSTLSISAWQRLRSAPEAGARIVEIEIDLGGGRDAELGEVVDHRGAVLGILHDALNAVQQVIFEGRLRILAQTAKP